MKKLRNVIIAVVCIALCVGYYFYLSNGNFKNDEAPTEMEQVMGKDLDKSYPSTAREVVKFYNRILCCLYNEEPTEEEIEKLAKQARKLFDEELLAENPEQNYIMSLQVELEEYGEKGSRITSTTLSNSQEIVYKEVNGYECAYVESSYYVKGKKEAGRAGQIYILRKDEAGNWKILGYYRPE